MPSKSVVCISCGTILFLIGAAIFVIGWTSKMIINKAIDDGVRDGVQIKTSDVNYKADSDWQTKFIRSDVDYFMWVYNISNFDRFSAGLEVPKYTLLGPYFYKEIDEMYNWGFNADGTIFSYNLWWKYEAQSQNPSGENDMIYTINIAYLATMTAANALYFDENALPSGDGYVTDANFLAAVFAPKAFGTGIGPTYTSRQGTFSKTMAQSFFMYLIQAETILRGSPGANCSGVFNSHDAVALQFGDSSFAANKAVGCSASLKYFELPIITTPLPLSLSRVLLAANSTALNDFQGSQLYFSAAGLGPLNQATSFATLLPLFGSEAQLQLVLQMVGGWAQQLTATIPNDPDTYEKVVVAGYIKSVEDNIKPILDPSLSNVPGYTAASATWWAAAKNGVNSFATLGAYQWGTGLVGMLLSSGASFTVLPAEDALSSYGISSSVTKFVGPEWAQFIYSMGNTSSTKPGFNDLAVCSGLPAPLIPLCNWWNMALLPAQAIPILDALGAGASSEPAINQLYLGINVQGTWGDLAAAIPADSRPVFYRYLFSSLPYWYAYRPLVYLNPNPLLRGGLFVKRPVISLFTGYFDPIIDLLTGDIYPGALGNYINATEHYSRTNQGKYQIYTGKSDINLARHWKGWRSMSKFSKMSDFIITDKSSAVPTCGNMMPHNYIVNSTWPTDATSQDCTLWASEEVIDGTTDGKHTFPFQEDVIAPVLEGVYVVEAHRRVNFLYRREVEVKGIKMRRYYLDMKYLYNATENTANAKYYMQAITANFQSPRGTAPCFRLYQGAPIYLHKAHFLDVDPSFYAGIEVRDRSGNLVTLGGTGDDDYDTFLDIEPLTGFAMQGHKRLQVSLWLPKHWITSETSAVLDGLPWQDLPPIPEHINYAKQIMGDIRTAKLIVPSYFGDEQGLIKDKDASDFKDAVYGNRDAAEVIKIVFIIVGFFWMVGSIVMIIYWVKRSRSGADTTSGEMSRLDSKANLA